MKKIFLIIVSTVICLSLFAQEHKTDSTINDDNDFDKEFKTIQVEAQFPGGFYAWNKYLEKNLNANLGSKYLKLPKGQTSIRQTVIVSFLVDKEGNIFEVKAENASEVHPKLAAEAVRVISSGPKWVPAIQNGKNVIYRQKQRITWEVSKG